MAVKKFNIYKLHFTSPVHLGDARDDYGISLTTIASDTLYAALVSCLAKQGLDIPKNGDLGCSVSSLFPFYQETPESETVLFFPKPLKQSMPTSQKAIDERKKVKKVTWLDAKCFSKALNGAELFDDAAIDSIKGKYMTSIDIDNDFIVSQVMQRVKVSRNGQQDAEPFYMDRVMFKGYSGLYFITEGDTTLLKKAMDLLQHEGIGTDRNVGNGCFVYEQSSVNLELPDSSDYAMILSSFVPESKEQLQSLLDSTDVAYDFERRGGWITTPPHNTLRKNVIYAFTAASVFKCQSKGVETKGNVGIDLKPDLPSIDHPIWRCGRALFIPIKLNSNGRNQ